MWELLGPTLSPVQANVPEGSNAEFDFETDTFAKTLENPNATKNIKSIF